MKNKYGKRMMATLMAVVMIIMSVNINAFADSKPYEITVENGRLEKVNHSIEKEHRDFIQAIVNTASDKMTTIYPKTFGHLKGSGLTLGLIEDEDVNSTSRALVSTLTAINHNPEAIQLGLALEVNMIQFRWPGKPISEENKNALVSVISHEMMHAMMTEALTSGLVGNKVTGDIGGRFPNWFIEGTAVVSGGGTEFVDSLLFYRAGKHMSDATLNESDIKQAISKANLVLGREPNSKNPLYVNASYGTGYLACMYLGSLVADDDGDISDEKPDVVKIRAGLDTLMSEIARGYSLDQAIKKLTKYDGLTDFEENSIDELTKYTAKLIEQIKDGQGSALTDLDSKYVLEPSSIKISNNPTILVNDKYTRMMNGYPKGHIVIKGGGRFNTGYDVDGNYPADAYAPDIVIKSESISGVSYDKKAGKITGLTDGTYEIDGQIVSTDVDGRLDSVAYEGKTISIVKKGHNYVKDSEPFKLSIPVKKTLNDGDIVFPSASDLTYGQKLKDSMLTLPTGVLNLGSFKWEAPDSVVEVGNNGYNVIFTPDADKVYDYTNLVPKTKKVKVRVRKATPIINLKINQSSPQQIQFMVNVLKDGFGELPTGNVELLAMGVRTSGSAITSNMNIGNIALNAGADKSTGTFNYHTTKQGVYTIVSRYSGDLNYNATTGASITIDTNKKNQADFKINDIANKTYGDEEFKLDTTGGSGNGTIRFESSDTDILSIKNDTASIKKAGMVKITAIKNGDEKYNETKSEIFVVIGRKELQVKANDKKMVVGESLPVNFEFDIKGLVDGDSFTNPVFTTNAMTLDTAGEFDIYISGGHFKEDCYNVMYKKGILHVVNKKDTSSSNGNSSNNSSSSGHSSKGSKNRSKSRTSSDNKRAKSTDGLINKGIQNKEDLRGKALKKEAMEKINTTLRQQYPENLVVSGKVFKDIKKSAWYASSVKFALENELMAGVSIDKFSPELNATRGMITTILYRLSQDEKVQQGYDFADVTNDKWYYEGVAWASRKGIVAGYSDNLFGAEDNITREQLVAILYSYAKYKNYDIKTANSLDKYTDLSEVSEYAVAPMQWAVENGLISGTSNTNLSPKKGTTRAELSIILMRFIEVFGK